MTEQQKWNRYVKAINYCIALIKRNSNKETTINLKPKHYKSIELLNLIQTQLG